ncbi:hypothetical protein B7494_g4280 [Chlorociboria aeruginascens]|nr:hypothetical protein B7494_g4280 [Chlorociboria aeruginascens]
MAPSASDLRQHSDLTPMRPSRGNPEPMARSASMAQRFRNDGKFRTVEVGKTAGSLSLPESWVEIASQPSSSSLSSIGDEIVTTGLRVQNPTPVRRRRRAIQPGQPTQMGLSARQTSTSSQEEYEESESEEDQVLSSSNERISPPPHSSRPEYDGGSEEEDDDEATALGMRTSEQQSFTPQPNAFSHPPAIIRSGSSNIPNPYSTRTTTPPYSRSNTSNYPARPRLQPSNTDHDAALRASLTTLLSCAAAARSLPKRNTRMNPGLNVPSTEPSFRLVPESEVMGVGVAANSSRSLTPSTRARSEVSAESNGKGKGSGETAGGKGKASATQKVGERRGGAKKKRVEGAAGLAEMGVSPTLLTWVVSAGVVVLVSVVGFGAGYVIGREVGRNEALGSLNGTTFSGGDAGVRGCGREMVRSSGSGGGGLRKFKWSGVTSVVA